jgi:hypothetical protein
LIHQPGKLGLVLKCSQNPALELNKVRFFIYFEVYRTKHGKSGAKKTSSEGMGVKRRRKNNPCDFFFVIKRSVLINV